MSTHKLIAPVSQKTTRPPAGDGIITGFLVIIFIVVSLLVGFFGTEERNRFPLGVSCQNGHVGYGCR
jgi:hypothetical protein